MANPTKQHTLDHCRAYLGVHEHNGDNRTIIGEKFGWNGVAWCAESIWVEFTDAGWTMPKTAGAFDMGNKLSARSGWKKVPASQIQSGDVVVYPFSHIGVCESRNGSNFVALEGNHNNAYVRVPRAISSASYGVRPPYGTEVVAPKPTPTPTPSGRRKMVVLQDTQGWNMTLGTKRRMLAKGGEVEYIGSPVTSKNGNKFVEVTWGGNTAWVRYDHLRWV